jgi:tryptophan-rich sensory protein
MTTQFLPNIALMYGILIGVNIPASLLGLDFDDDTPRQRLWFEPPGYVIPIAWFGLFALLALALQAIAQVDPTASVRWWVVGLAVLCATYAYYTLGLQKLTHISALWFGLVGNLVVIVAALAIAYAAYLVSATAAYYILPVAVWTTYATAIVIGELKAQK